MEKAHKMQEKKKQYILDDLLRIILAMFVLTVLFAFSCLLLSHGARGIWLAVLALFLLAGAPGCMAQRLVWSARGTMIFLPSGSNF